MLLGYTIKMSFGGWGEVVELWGDGKTKFGEALVLTGLKEATFYYKLRDSKQKQSYRNVYHFRFSIKYIAYQFILVLNLAGRRDCVRRYDDDFLGDEEKENKEETTRNERGRHQRRIGS